jgi:mRNA-degrading endonuclease toxin of MazEF toxin-antitoxin module
VAVDCSGKTAVAVVDQIRAIAKERLRSKIATLSDNEMDEIASALRQILDLA